jgi:prophage endopeptidase
MSLFNPWVLLGIVLAVLGAGTSGYLKGSADEFDRQQLEIAALNAKARETEQRLQADAQETADKLRKQNDEASKRIENLKSDISSGKRKLFIPVKATACPTIQATADAPAPSGDSVQTGAELDREAAKTLISITDDGDKAIRQLNACIDAYNAVYQTLNSKQ